MKATEVYQITYLLKAREELTSAIRHGKFVRRVDTNTDWSVGSACADGFHRKALKDAAINCESVANTFMLAVAKQELEKVERQLKDFGITD